MSLTSAILKFAAPLPNIEGFDRFMFIGPHPDDIEIGAGATAAKLTAMGKDVSFVVCTDGRYGDDFLDKPLGREQLVALRQEEAKKSAAALGVNDIRFLNLKDGGFYEDDELIRALAGEIGRFKPQVIFAPDPDGSSECHADHLNVGRAAKRLAYFAPYKGIMAEYGAEYANVEAIALYMTAKPNSYVGTKGFVSKQLQSVFSNHLSQFPSGCKDAHTISLYIRIRSIDFGLRSLKGQAEGFRVLGRTHMHCLPEAGK